MTGVDDRKTCRVKRQVEVVSCRPSLTKADARSISPSALRWSWSPNSVSSGSSSDSQIVTLSLAPCDQHHNCRACSQRRREQGEVSHTVDLKSTQMTPGVAGHRRARGTGATSTRDRDIEKVILVGGHPKSYHQP